MAITNMWVAEYSKSQDCCHIETIEQMLAANRNAIFGNKAVDYIPFGICQSLEEANALCNKMRKIKEGE